jgi:hypothetical protein
MIKVTDNYQMIKNTNVTLNIPPFPENYNDQK